LDLPPLFFVFAVGEPQLHYNKGDFIYQRLIAKAKRNPQTIWGFYYYKKPIDYKQ